MYERIFIPLDGSEVGESALPYVEDLLSKLAPEVKVEVTLFQVLRPVHPYVVGGYGVPDISYTEKEMEENKKKAIDYLNKAGETLRSKGATVTSRVGVGDASEEIIKAAEEINADLIAMSTHGRSGLSRWAFGSVTDKVLRRGGRIPILTVSAPRKDEKA
jgi:nucleotide-binding universal stress UspA family protein